MDIPVGTVSTNRDDRTERERETRKGGTRKGAVRDAQQSHRRATLERRVALLEAELDRKDRQLQSVIDRYERLLAEAHEESADTGGRSRTDERGLRSAVRAALDR